MAKAKNYVTDVWKVHVLREHSGVVVGGESKLSPWY